MCKFVQFVGDGGDVKQRKCRTTTISISISLGISELCPRDKEKGIKNYMKLFKEWTVFGESGERTQKYFEGLLT